MIFLNSRFTIAFFLSLLLTYSANAQEGYRPFSTTGCSNPNCRVATTPETGPLPSSSDYDSYRFPSKMESFGTNDVDLYSGTPSIQIPLYTVQCRDLSLPLSLAYDASGIKVSQEASWVGLGWNLTGASSITRIMRGEDDFLSYSTDKPENYVNVTPVTNSWRWDERSNPCVTEYTGMGGINIIPTYQTEKDLQTDIFVVNVGGRTIKFVLDPSRLITRQVYILEKEKIRIKLLYANANGNLPVYKIPSFEITTEDGTRYYYGDDISSVVGSQDNYAFNDNYLETVKVETRNYILGSNYAGPSKTIASSWLLRKIITPLGDEVNFTYDKHYVETPFIKSETNVYNTLNNLQYQTPDKIAVTDQLVKSATYRLKEITFPLGKVSFIKNYNRTDVIPVYPGQRSPDPSFTSTQRDPSLSAVEVYSNFNNLKLIKKFELTYSYFNNSVTTTPLKYYRLKLSSVKEVDVITGAFKPSYVLNYNESLNFGTVDGVALSLPSKLSMGKDHWGYCNNKNAAETTLKPTKEKVVVNSDLVSYLGLDRDADVNYSHAGVLTKITYPTGGFSEFTFDPHDYNSLILSDVQKEVGGLRIKQIRVSDGVNTAKDMYTVYKYQVADTLGNLTTTSSGVLMEDVMYTRVPVGTTAGWPVYRSGNNVLPKGTHSLGGVVGYSEVTVLSGLNGELGKTIYKFHAYPNYQYDNFTPSDFAPAAYYEFVYDIIHQRNPSFSSETSANKKYLYVLNGKLKNSKSFKKNNSTYVPVTEIESAFNEFDNTLLANAALAYNVEMKGVGGGCESVWCCTNQTPTTTCSPTTPIGYINDCTLDNVEIISYVTPHLKVKQTRLKEYMYDQNTLARKFIKESTFEFANDDHYQLSKVCFDDPTNTAEITCIEYFYPADYKNNQNTADMVKRMGDAANTNYRHIHSPIVEQITKRKEAGTFKVIGAYLNKFKYADVSQISTSPIVVDEVLQLEVTTPLTETTNTTTANTAGYFINSKNRSISTFAYDNDYPSQPRVKNNLQDTKGNTTEILNQINQPSVVIYGYSKSLPVAKVANANRSQVTFTNFEEGVTSDDEGWGWANCSLMTKDNAPEKPHVYSGNRSIKVPIANGSAVYGPTKDITPMPQTGKYKLSCYIKADGPVNGYLSFYTHAGDGAAYPAIPQAGTGVHLINSNGQWQYYEVILDLDLIKQSAPSTTLFLRAFIVNYDPNYPIYADDIRVHPVDAEMETTTYAPLVGPTSVSDINSIPAFTEYDGFNRVKLIRDQDQNIIKRYKYVYKE